MDEMGGRDCWSEATAGRALKISRMGEMGCRDCWSEATAEKRCLGLLVGVRARLDGWKSPVRGGAYRWLKWEISDRKFPLMVSAAMPQPTTLSHSSWPSLSARRLGRSGWRREG